MLDEATAAIDSETGMNTETVFVISKFGWTTFLQFISNNHMFFLYRRKNSGYDT
jgi:hypothetical protein